MLHSLFAQSYNYTYGPTTTSNGPFPWGTFLAIMTVTLLVTIFLIIIPLWKIYQKAGRPGWAAIVPIYNNWVLFEIVGYPGWWAILSLVPFVNIFPAIMSIVAYFKLAKLFGKSSVFGVMLILFPWVCLPILGFGDAVFQGSQQDGDDQSFGGPVPPESPSDSFASNPITFNSPQPPADTTTPEATPTPTAPTTPDNTPPPPTPPVNPIS